MYEGMSTMIRDVSFVGEIGPERAARVIDFTDMTPREETLARAQVIGADPETFIYNERALILEMRNWQSPPHLTETIEQEEIAYSLTFGVSEPTYLELMGREDFLRVRSIEKPRFLLVGSYGKYSTSEFDDFAKKINPNAETVTIDIEQDFLPIYKRVQEERDIAFAFADAKKMPFRGGSFDVVCTNHLLHFLVDGRQSTLRQEKDMQNFLNEMFDILKEEGIVLSEEQRYGQHVLRRASGDEMRNSFFSDIAKSKFGRKSDIIFSPSYRYMLRSDVGSVHVDDSGVALYGEAPLAKDSRYLAFKLRK